MVEWTSFLWLAGGAWKILGGVALSLTVAATAASCCVGVTVVVVVMVGFVRVEEGVGTGELATDDSWVGVATDMGVVIGV